jgi:cardiolipin synthase
MGHPEWLGWAVFIADWVVRLALAARVVLRRLEPPVRTAWLVVLIFVPVLGVFAYVLFGEARLGTRRVRRYNELVGRLDAEAIGLWRHRNEAFVGDNAPFGHIAIYGTAVGGFPPLAGNQLELHADSEKTLDAIVADIEAAKHHVHLLTYIWDPGSKTERVGLAMELAAARGVQCRVLVDAVGSKRFLRSARCASMRRAGVNVVPALPVAFVRALFARIDLRNHRKIVVIDGEIAYCGSQNIADSSFRSKPWIKTGPWVDCTVRIRGPAAQALAVLFLTDWQLDSEEQFEDVEAFLPALTPVTGEGPGHTSVVQVIPSGPGPAPASVAQAIVACIHVAREELIVTTPYFVPDEAFKAALMAAAVRGVAVHVVVPAVLDSLLVRAASRSHYLDMLEAGVRIHHYRGGLLHSKTVTVDRDLAVIGSANLDTRSFRLNFEVTMMIYDTDVASLVRFMQRGYIEQSDDVRLTEWRRRPWYRKAVENSAQLVGPLL